MSGEEVTEERQAWRQARSAIAEYESKAAELQLDLQQSQKEAQAAKDRLLMQRKEIGVFEKKTRSLHAACVTEMSKTQELKRQLAGEGTETQRLAHHLTSERKKLGLVQEQQETLRKEREEHIQMMKAHLTRLGAGIEA